MIARNIRVRVSHKGQIGSELRRNNLPRNTAAPGRESKAAEGPYPDISQRVRSAAHAEPDQQVVAAKVRNEISPEVQDWLNRVVLPILKKVIFNV
jgi:hypothetical protein